ncbi:uncharacterized protein LOC141576068 isoform X6 [Camelus bactrianus]|uniref:Uncharacterized protein LOC141576068 isoform X6 n=1 Tax=Camelus bactrianus TaxID=9837 RepID=A0AC58PX79_CAMBA
MVGASLLASEPRTELGAQQVLLGRVHFISVKPCVKHEAWTACLAWGALAAGDSPDVGLQGRSLLSQVRRTSISRSACSPEEATVSQTWVLRPLLPKKPDARLQVSLLLGGGRDEVEGQEQPAVAAA